MKPLIQSFPVFNKRLTKELHMWHWWSDKRIQIAFEFTVGQLKPKLIGVAQPGSGPMADMGRVRALLTETTLFARKFSNQLPEL